MKRLFTLLSFALVWSLCYANIPIDFSRVGYMWGEKAIPDYPVYTMLTAPEDGRDFTSLLQLCLNQVPSGGAILLKAAGTQKRTLITLGTKTPGPNVFLNCTMEHAYSDAGPHQRPYSVV